MMIFTVMAVLNMMHGNKSSLEYCGISSKTACYSRAVYYILPYLLFAVTMINVVLNEKP